VRNHKTKTSIESARAARIKKKEKALCHIHTTPIKNQTFTSSSSRGKLDQGHYMKPIKLVLLPLELDQLELALLITAHHVRKRVMVTRHEGQAGRFVDHGEY